MSERPEDTLSWLRSQILARKAAAEDLDGAAWGVLDYVSERPDGGGDEQVMLVDVAEDAELFSIRIGATAANEDHLRHIALNDPQDTLARCESELMLLDLAEAETHFRVDDPWYSCSQARDEDGEFVGNEAYRGSACNCGRDAQVERTTRVLAYAYRARPGWLPEWAPETAKAAHTQ